MDEEWPIKPLHWIGSSKADLLRLPDEIKRVTGFALFEAQIGSKHLDAKPLKGFGGAGVIEVVSDDRDGTYRAVYTVKFRSAIYVLHVFQKKSRKGIATPAAEIEKVRQRLKLAAEHHRETYE